MLLAVGPSDTDQDSHHGSPNSQVWELRLTPSTSLILRLSVPSELYHQLSWFSSLQMADGGTSQPLLLCEPIPIKKNLSISFIYTYIPLILFPWRMLTNPATKFGASFFYTAIYNQHISDLHKEKELSDSSSSGRSGCPGPSF